MPKPNLLGLRRPARKTVTRAFTDPEQPGAEVTLTLRRLDPLDAMRYQEAAVELVEMYAGAGIPVGEELVPVTEGVARTLCAIEAMQPFDAAERYSAEELAALAVTMPNAWGDLYALVGELNLRPEESLGN